MKLIYFLLALLFSGCMSAEENKIPTATGDQAMIVRMQTNHGTIVLELDKEKAPDTVANFVSYVKSGAYDGTIFHRVIPGFMLQGGGFEPGMKQKRTSPPIKNEASNGLRNITGSIAMARTSDPHSATSQFFINVADNPPLDHRAPTAQGWGYCVFGKVIEGMEVVREIERVKTTRRAGHRDVPVEDVVIEMVTLDGET